MKRWLDAANEYIKTWSICDVALLKLCVCAAGVMFGMAIPKRHRDKAAFAASAVFTVTYILVMMPFLRLMTGNETKE